MLRLNRKQRTAVNDTARQAGNLALAALVFGQFVGSRALSWQLLVAGIALWVMFFACGVVLLKGTER
jgi:hypothetical protein